MRVSGGIMSVSSQQKRFTEEFKIEAVRQITERGHRVADVAERLGVSTHSLYQWRKRYGQADGISLRREADLYFRSCRAARDSGDHRNRPSCSLPSGAHGALPSPCLDPRSTTDVGVMAA